MRFAKVITLFAIVSFTTISCSDKNGHNSVDQEPTLVLNKTSLSLNQEETFTLTAEIKYSKRPTIDSFTWSSSNEDVARVSSGKVTAIGVGTAIITAKATFYDNYSAQCEVTVTREAGFDYEIGKPDGKVIDDYYRFYIPVKNTGTMNICLYRMTYQITNKYDDELYDSFFSMSSAPMIIAPGETGYFYDTPYNGHGSFEGKTSNDLVVIQHPIIRKANDYKCERYQVSEPTIVDSEYGFGSYIEGSLTNNSSARITKPAIALHLFDQNNKFVYCLTSSFQEGINPGETKEYSISLPNYGGDRIDKSEIARIKAIAYDNVEFTIDN